jgi:predicted NBD/HSP70 family sugar kinase
VADLRELLRKPSGAKEENRLKILRAIMARSSNQTDLVRRSGMSSATVSGVVNELVQDGAVRSERRGRDTVVSMKHTHGVAVGVELGFQHTAVVARRVHQPYTEAAVRTAAVGGNSGEQRWLESVVGLIRDIASETGEGPEELTTIGLGIPGMVDPRTEQLTPPLLPPWEDVADPASRITDRLREIGSHHGASLPAELRVRLDNDATLGALAESTYMYPQKETLVYIKASTGVGAGIVISGRVFRGRRGVAGEIGHTVVDRNGRFCLCGGRGCLETLVGAMSLLDQARTALGDRSPRSLNDLVEKGRQGNAVCRRVLREAAFQLGLALGDLCNVLNPDVVVIGGAFGRAADTEPNLILEPCRAGIHETAVTAAHEEEFALVSSKVEHATAHGALLLGIEGTEYS